MVNFRLKNCNETSENIIPCRNKFSKWINKFSKWLSKLLSLEIREANYPSGKVQLQANLLCSDKASILGSEQIFRSLGIYSLD